MAIVEIKIDAIKSFADGQAFSEAGSYLQIKGIAKGKIDPAAPENRVIADLDKATNPRGQSTQLYQEIAPTSVEDRVMVEAQQGRFSELGGRRPHRHCLGRHPDADAAYGRPTASRSATSRSRSPWAELTSSSCVRQSKAKPSRLAAAANLNWSV